MISKLSYFLLLENQELVELFLYPHLAFSQAR